MKKCGAMLGAFGVLLTMGSWFAIHGNPSNDARFICGSLGVAMSMVGFALFYSAKS